jgi:uncharacterized protein with von Willebrand factor type A (vWA) domain
MICCSEPGGTARLLPNLIHFARLQRRKGLAVSAAKIADAAHGLAHVDLARRDDVFHTPRSILVFGQSWT